MHFWKAIISPNVSFFLLSFVNILGGGEGGPYLCTRIPVYHTFPLDGYFGISKYSSYIFVIFGVVFCFSVIF